MTAAAPQIGIRPQSALADVPLHIRLGGLPAGASVTVRARMPGWPGHRWESHATFVADAPLARPATAPANGGVIKPSSDQNQTQALALLAAATGFCAGCEAYKLGYLLTGRRFVACPLPPTTRSVD